MDHPVLTVYCKRKWKTTREALLMPNSSLQIPKEHKFVVSSVAMQSLAVLSHTAGDKQAEVPVPDRLSVEGKVVQRAECRPISNNVYLSIKKEALLKPKEEARQTKQLSKVVNSYKPVANHAFNKMHQVSHPLI